MTPNKQLNVYSKRDHVYSIDQFLELTWEELFEVPVYLDENINPGNQVVDNGSYQEDSFLELSFEELFDVPVRVFRLEEEAIEHGQDARVSSLSRDLNGLTLVSKLVDFLNIKTGHTTVLSQERNINIDFDLGGNIPPQIEPPVFPPDVQPPPPPPPVINPAPIPPSSLEVREEYLPNGSSPNSANLVFSGNVFDAAPSVNPEDINFNDLITPGYTVIKNGGMWTFDLGFITLTFYADNVDSNVKGDYELTLNDATNHSPGLGMNSLFVSFTLIYTDETGSLKQASMLANIIDDVPDVTVESLSSISLISGDSNIPTNVSDNVQELFNFITSADIPNQIQYQLHLTSNDVDSGLKDTQTGESIILRQMNNEVVGYITINNTDIDVFKITLDVTSGELELTQLRSILHPLAEENKVSGSNEQVSLNAGLLEVIANITDNDIDIKSASTDISQAFVFSDSYPTIELSQVPVPELTTDDTDIVTSFGPVSFKDLFDTSFGGDNFKDVDKDGEEDADAIAYQLSLKDGNGTQTGLYDTATGLEILLKVDVLGHVVGYVTINNVDTQVFLVELNANTADITLTQSRAVQHPIAESNVTDSESDETVSFDADLIRLSATITDGDLDTKSLSRDIGQAFIFFDAYPEFTQVNDDDSDEVIEVNTLNPMTDAIYPLQLLDWSYSSDGPNTNTPIELEVTQGNIQIVSIDSDTVVLQFMDSQNNPSALLTLKSTGEDTLNLLSRMPVEAILSEGVITKKGQPVSQVLEHLDINDLVVTLSGDDGNNIPNENTDKINGSNQGYGVGQNVIEVGESFIITFSNVSSTPQSINDLSFIASGFTGGKEFQLEITVWYNNTDSETLTTFISDGDTVIVSELSGFGLNGLTEFQKVEIKHIDPNSTIKNANSGFRVDDITIFDKVVEPPEDLDYEFNLTITDGDKDSATQLFSFKFDGDPIGNSSGITVDGPIAGATVFQDMNVNAQLDSNESSTLSLADGSYLLDLRDANDDGLINEQDGRLVSFGGVDTLTQLEYAIPLLAPLGSSVISPLTSILCAQYQQGKDLRQVHTQLVSLLGLSEKTLLTELNPFEELEYQQDVTPLLQAASIMTLSVQLSSAYSLVLNLAPNEVAEQVYTSIGNQILLQPDALSVTFSDKSFIENIMRETGELLSVDSQHLNPLLDILVKSQQAIENTLFNSPDDVLIENLSDVQTLTQGYFAKGIDWYMDGQISAEGLELYVDGLLSNLGHDNSNNVYELDGQLLNHLPVDSVETSVIGYGGTLVGDENNNLLYGFNENTTYHGGEGDDIFVIKTEENGSHYTFTDFELGQDILCFDQILESDQLMNMIESAVVQNDSFSTVTVYQDNSYATLTFQSVAIDSTLDLQTLFTNASATDL